MTSKRQRKVRRTQKLGQDRLITFLEKQGREIHDQVNVMERIEELYTELYDSEQNTIIHTDPEDSIMGGGSSTTRYEEWNSNRQRPYIDTLKAGEDTISKTLAKQYTKCL